MVVSSPAPAPAPAPHFRDNLTRWTGTLGIIGGVALAASYLAHPSSSSPEIVGSPGWIWIHVGFMISLVAGVFLLVALFGKYLRHGGGVAGLIGFVFSTVSLIFVFGLDYAEVFIFPTLASTFPEVIRTYGDGTMMPSIAFAFPVTGVLFVIGFLLFSWQLWAKRATSRSAALTTFVGTLVFGVGLSGLAPIIVVRVGALIFGAGLALLGFELWRNQS